MANLVNDGWIKVWRELMSKSIWLKSSPEHIKVLFAVLMLANHERNEWEWKGEKYVCEPGQLITSLDSLKNACGYGVSTQNIRSALVRFEKLGFLTNESTKTGRLITVVNWAKYQGGTGQPNIATNKEVTKSQQRGNKEVTPNKNDKKDKNDKNSVCTTPDTHTEPDLETIEAYCRENGITTNVKKFFAYNQVRKWKVGNRKADWKELLNLWVQQDEDKDPAPGASESAESRYNVDELEALLVNQL